MSRKYYAVYTGRVDKPTIYSSWAQAHPRVIQCKNEYKEFKTRQDAINWLVGEMQATNIHDATEDGDMVRSSSSSPSPSKKKYYAVAYGRQTGVFHNWEDAKGATSGFTSACHESFRTEHEAKQFIEDWREACADVWRLEIRRGLNDGWKPEDLAVDISKIMAKEGVLVESACKKFEELDIAGKNGGIKSESLV
ncbi:hypothetical protein SI65_07342 [Aspergillus cristatus]|uniref:Ribonuclease H1 N-terminal domain-containing protein n=1 Tax=Aspergillus cristatus TaxID=573508 RepID=A0A1E3B7N4_ASPCR|nr:hypothetical protein SI65_07342 [Aspergillus cristatus]